MPVSEVSKRLFELLDRDELLERSIASSADLLSSPQRALLARLSIFRGGWTLDQAEAVCGDGKGTSIRGRAIITLLSELVDHSLVRYGVRNGRSRYQMLETVRDFCRSHLLRARTADGLRRKHLLRLAMAGALPDSVLREGKTPGFQEIVARDWPKLAVGLQKHRWELVERGILDRHGLDKMLGDNTMEETGRTLHIDRFYISELFAQEF